MLTTSTTAANSDRLFATEYRAPIVPLPSVPKRTEQDETTFFQKRVQELHEANECLSAQLEKACWQIEELKQLVAQKFPELEERRKLVCHLALDGRSSKNNLCKLLGVARSSFWYRVSNDFEVRCDVDLAKIRKESLERVLYKMAMDLKNGRKITCSATLAKMQIGLKRLGMRIAASLVQDNPKLAMDIFLAHHSESTFTQKL